MLLELQSSAILRLRIRRRFLVAKSVKSLGEGYGSLVGEGGADLAMACIFITGAEPGKSSETVRFGRIENLGMGKELGGGEFE